MFFLQGRYESKIYPVSRQKSAEEEKDREKSLKGVRIKL